MRPADHQTTWLTAGPVLAVPMGDTASRGHTWGSPGPVMGGVLQGTSIGRGEEAG